jgi:cobalt/nickel transport system permease protein
VKHFAIAAALFAALVSFYSDAAAGWSGVDETVVEKIAAEHGREASGPLINTDQGDLLLFVFLVAGAAGGFAGGYCYRMLTETKRGPKHR